MYVYICQLGVISTQEDERFYINIIIEVLVMNVLKDPISSVTRRENKVEGMIFVHRKSTR